MNNFQRFRNQLLSDSSGLALIEFAYALPLLLGLVGFGLEMTNLASTSTKVSQAAMALSDNMSRVGLESALSRVQLRESDINDGFIGIQRGAAGLGLTSGGRVIISSLERNAQGGQWIHWQRCIGTKLVTSSYGTQGTGISGTSFLGMGPAGARVTAPAGQAVMFVEIVYDYQPLFTTLFIPARTIRFEQSFIVRDERDLVGPTDAGHPEGYGVFNPSPAAPVHNCTSYTAT